MTVKTNGDTHNFVLVFSGPAEIDGALEDGLFEAGCDDATLAFRNGVYYLEFDRRAPSRDAAIRSAVRDVQRADPRITGVSVEADRWS